MKKAALLMLMSALMLQACSGRSEYAAREERNLTQQEQELTRKQYETTGEDTVSVEEVKKESAEAFSKSAAYLAQERQKIYRKMNTTIKELDARIAELKDDANSATGEAKSRIQVDIKGLEDEKQALLKMQSELGQATQEAWADMKKAWEKMEVDINTKIKPSSDRQS